MDIRNEKIIAFYAAIIAVIIAAVLCMGPIKAYAQEEHVWVLVEKKNFDQKEAIQKYNQDTDVGKNLYRYELSCTPGNYTGRGTYVGGATDSTNPPTLEGETLAAQAVFGSVPDLIYPDQKINLTLSLSVLDKNLSFYSWNAMAFADFNPPDADPSGGVGGYPAFRNAGGNNWFEINKGNNWKAVSETISAEYRAGREEGERVALRTRFRFSNWSIGTNHIYEWKAVNAETRPETTAPDEEDPYDDYSGLAEQYTGEYTPPTRKQEYSETGINFSDLSGEILIRSDDNRLGWEFVELETKVNYGDHIMTGKDSYCILSLPDMTTFVMKPESEIIIPYPEEKESALSLLAGKVLVNVKKMIKDGSMKVEMSQAVAGIKGTILICESNETSSGVQVLEGQVEVADLSGIRVLLDTGQQVAAQDGTLGQVQQFSVDDELQDWPEEAREQIYADIAKRAGETAGEEAAAAETAAQETTVQETTDNETDYKELFQEKIAEHERHVKSRSLLKYVLWIALLSGAAASVFMFMKKKRYQSKSR